MLIAPFQGLRVRSSPKRHLRAKSLPYRKLVQLPLVRYTTRIHRQPLSLTSIYSVQFTASQHLQPSRHKVLTLLRLCHRSRNLHQKYRGKCCHGACVFGGWTPFGCNFLVDTSSFGSVSMKKWSWCRDHSRCSQWVRRGWASFSSFILSRFS